MESEEGCQLLRKLAERLRESSLYLPPEQYTIQDELMRTFAGALELGKDSMAAYRDVLFKMNRGFIVNHPQVGYSAPWGMGLSRSKAVYQKANNPTPSLTISSANTQAPDNLLTGKDPQKPMSGHPPPPTQEIPHIAQQNHRREPT